MIYGLFELPWWGYLLVTFFLTHITAVSITLYLHRSMAHRALDLHPIVSHFFRFWLWLTTGMVTKAWTAIHRKHHARCETDEDPHSPQRLGIKKVLWEGAELYRKESLNEETLQRYGHGTPDDWMERNVYSKHSSKGVWLMLIINLVLFGIPGLTVWALQMIWTPFFAAGIINGIGHYWGYRNFECEDASTNISPVGFLIAGEELHNNHHTFGSSAKFSVKPWEFDIGWGYIKVLKMFNLVKVKRLPPELHYQPEKKHIDIDTVKAIVTNRFEIMSRYSKEVVVPVFQELHAKQPNALTGKIRKLLVREKSLVINEDKQILDNALSSHQSLEVVYRFRQQLQNIWMRTTASQKELLDALQEWCHQAEATGIKVLQDFAQQVRTFSVQPA